MKKLILATTLWALSMIVPGPTLAAVDISIGVSLPPLFVLQAPPVVVALPDTHNVYVVPDVDVDIFFWNGWWWMPWEGRWYRSSHYDRGWLYYNSVPSFYFDVDPGWRRYYRDRNWYGHSWRYERIPYQRLQQNWKSWHGSRHWERQGTWGVQNYRPRPQQQRQELRRQRQEHYQQRPEVRRYQQQREQLRRQPQVQQPRQQPQKRVQQPRSQERKPAVNQPRQQPRQEGQQPGKQPRPQEKPDRDR